MEREIYLRLMLIQKANDLGIHVGDDAVATMANEMLRIRSDATARPCRWRNL